VRMSSHKKVCASLRRLYLRMARAAQHLADFYRR
jgi:hypothetical protein